MHAYHAVCDYDNTNNVLEYTSFKVQYDYYRAYEFRIQDQN
jgi:hypothetical protein